MEKNRKVQVRVRYTWLLTVTSIFAAISFMLTTIFIVATPATKGFFNLGDSGVYIAALIGGPLVGALGGGIGSALADIFLGYSWYAPGTLIIKGIEGYIVGITYMKLRNLSKEEKVVLSFSAAILLFLVLSYFGWHGATTVLRLGDKTFQVEISREIFVTTALLLSMGIIYLGIRGGAKGVLIFSCILGGIEMVIGYFLYEAIVLGYGLVAIAEIPINVGQMIIGSSIAVPVVVMLSEMGVDVESKWS